MGGSVHSVMVGDPYLVPCIPIAIILGGDNPGKCPIYHVVEKDVDPVSSVRGGIIGDSMGDLYPYLLVSLESIVSKYPWWGFW